MQLRRLERFAARLAALDGSLGALSPLAILERGYAIVRTEAGELVRDNRQAAPGDHLGVRLHRGRLSVSVGETSKRRRLTRAAGAILTRVRIDERGAHHMPNRLLRLTLSAVVLAVACGTSGGGSETVAAEAAAAGETIRLPDFSLKDANGKEFTKADVEGRVVLLNFLGYLVRPLQDRDALVHRLPAQIQRSRLHGVGRFA